MISFLPFRNLIKEKNISTYYLRNKCEPNNLDSKTITRLMSDQSVSTNTINSLCEILECDLSDIVKFIPHNDTENNSK